MLPAILALTIHNAGIIGYLMGRHADTLDYRPDAPTGANLYFYETLPLTIPRLSPLPLGDHSARERHLRPPRRRDARLLRRRGDFRAAPRRGRCADPGRGRAVHDRRRLLPRPTPPPEDRRAADAPVGRARRAPRPARSARMRLTGGPIVKDVVLVGAGHAHVAVLRRFGMKPLPGVRFTLIARELHTPYSGMLPGLVAGLYGFDDAHIDTGPLARFAGARLYHDTAIGLDLTNKWVICRDRPPVPFDLLSPDMGSTPNTGFVPGAAEHAIPVKPISEFLPRLEALIPRLREGGGGGGGGRVG